MTRAAVSPDQANLFGDIPPLPDPGRPAAQAHRGAGDTETAAAAHAGPRAGTIRWLLMQRLTQCAFAGVTGSEAHRHIRTIHGRTKETSVRPRLSELVRDGWAEDSGLRRRADDTQPAEIVYVLTAEGRDTWRAMQAELSAVR